MMMGGKYQGVMLILCTEMFISMSRALENELIENTSSIKNKLILGINVKIKDLSFSSNAGKS
jgi:hypothetical protein